jgi:hypothetical protein
VAVIIIHSDASSAVDELVAVLVSSTEEITVARGVHRNDATIGIEDWRAGAS